MKQWTKEKPTEAGRYMLRDTIYDWKTEVEIIKHLNGKLWVRPKGEARLQGLGTIGEWCEWKAL